MTGTLGTTTAGTGAFGVSTSGAASTVVTGLRNGPKGSRAGTLSQRRAVALSSCSDKGTMVSVSAALASSPGNGSLTVSLTTTSTGTSSLMPPGKKIERICTHHSAAMPITRAATTQGLRNSLFTVRPH